MIIENSIVEENVRIVDSKRNYWFMRTYGGETYSDFLRNNYIGIGFNSVPLKYINDTKSRKDVEAFKRLKEYIEIKEDVISSTATKYTNQLLQFHHNMKDGDIVIIPNKNSDYYSIGIIQGESWVMEGDNRTFQHKDKFIKFPEKRRNVEWVKTVEKHDIKNDIGGSLNIRQTISKVNHVSEKIEGFISSVFIKEKQMYLVIKIDQDEDINAFALNDFLSTTIYFYKEFCKENGIEENEDLFIKIKLQSRGKLVLKAAAYGAVFSVMVMMALTQDAEFNVEYGDFKINGKSGDGVLKSWSDFKDGDLEREMKYEIFQDSMRRLKASTLKENITDSIKEKGEENNRENETN